MDFANIIKLDSNTLTNRLPDDEHVKAKDHKHNITKTNNNFLNVKLNVIHALNKIKNM